MISDIILIGPMGTGKSTLGELLSERLGVPQISLDELRWEYYREVGYDDDTARRIREAEGFEALVEYWKQFDAHSVERVLSDYRNCVIDFGAGASVYDDPIQFQRVQALLAPYRNVVLLLPSPDLDESARILHNRNVQHPFKRDKTAIVERHLRHPSNIVLAKFIVYTKGKSPGESCSEVLQRLAL